MKHQGKTPPDRGPRTADRVASLFRAISRRSMISVWWTGFELVDCLNVYGLTLRGIV